MEQNIYVLYVLTLDGSPVYVGVTELGKTRISQHKKSGKKFDGWFILKKYNNKKEALAAENGIIRFMTVFYPTALYNAQDVNLVGIRNYDFQNV